MLMVQLSISPVKFELGKVVEMGIFTHGNYLHPARYAYENSLKPKVRVWVRVCV